MKRSLWVWLAVMAAGCAYYNGLYNANRLVDQAEKAEREGRAGEARTLWTRVIIKAETTLARYPESGYRDDALLLLGRGLREVGDCRGALDPLREIVDSSPDPAVVFDARINMGRCYVELDKADSAVAVLEPAIESTPRTRNPGAAYRWRGRAYLSLGLYDAALRDLRGSPSTEARFDEAIALSAIGQPDSAYSLLASQLRDDYVEVRWRSVLDSLGQRSPELASRLVDLLLGELDLSRGQRARLLIDDGKRLARSDAELAGDRYMRAIEAAGDSIERRVARAHLGVNRLRTADDPEAPAELQAMLADAVGGGGEAARVAGPALRTVDRYLADLRTTRHRELRLFLRAEEFRDSVRAYSLASAIFQGIARQAPDSPIAPKALIAAAQIDQEDSDQLFAAARSGYPRSPYVVALNGGASERYSVVEDSLRTLILALGGVRGEEGLDMDNLDEDDAFLFNRDSTLRVDP